MTNSTKNNTKKSGKKQSRELTKWDKKKGRNKDTFAKGYHKGMKTSFNLKTLDSMFKIVQNKEDKKNVIYSGRSKESLEDYVEKEGTPFKSNKGIKNSDLNHLIISPIHPLLYKDLTEEEKLIVKQESVKWTQKEFGKYS